MKKNKKSIELKEYPVRDHLKNRNLIMFVSSDQVDDFESCSSFYRKVEMSKKIVDQDTKEVYKNKVNEYAHE